MSPRRSELVSAAGVRRAVLAVIAVVLAGGCATTVGSRSSDPARTPMVSSPVTPKSAPHQTPISEPPPPAGACYQLTSRDLARFSDHDWAVPCGRTHTGVTFFVGRLPAHVVARAHPVTDPGVQKAASHVCSPRFRRYIGGDWHDRLLARLNFTFYLPSAAGFESGIRWVRCDLYLTRRVDGGKTYLGPLPAHTRGILDQRDALDSYGICSPSAPGAAGFKVVLCAHRHRWRAIAPIRLGHENTAWPGVQQVKKLGDSRCSDAVRQWLGYPTTWRYGWQWPSHTDWTSGQRFGYCWAQFSG